MLEREPGNTWGTPEAERSHQREEGTVSDPDLLPRSRDRVGKGRRPFLELFETILGGSRADRRGNPGQAHSLASSGMGRSSQILFAAGRHSIASREGGPHVCGQTIGLALFHRCYDVSVKPTPAFRISLTWATRRVHSTFDRMNRFLS